MTFCWSRGDSGDPGSGLLVSIWGLRTDEWGLAQGLEVPRFQLNCRKQFCGAVLAPGGVPEREGDPAVLWEHAWGKC